MDQFQFSWERYVLIMWYWQWWGLDHQNIFTRRCWQGHEMMPLQTITSKWITYQKDLSLGPLEEEQNHDHLLLLFVWHYVPAFRCETAARRLVLSHFPPQPWVGFKDYSSRYGSLCSLFCWLTLCKSAVFFTSI